MPDAAAGAVMMDGGTVAQRLPASPGDLRAMVAEYRDRCGQDIAFWWRDDDLTSDGSALQRLSMIGARTGIEPLLAIIPGHADAALGSTLSELGGKAWYAQHGFVHFNHEQPGADPSEFGAGRVGAPGLRDIAEGRAILLAMGLPRFLDVFVPPWNRVDPAFLPLLPRLGITGVSGYVGHCGFSEDDARAAGLVARHAAVEVTRWSKRPEMFETGLLLGRLTELIQAGPQASTAETVPLRIGILTHHRVMHEPEFDALEALFGIVSTAPGCQWLEPPDVFA